MRLLPSVLACIFQVLLPWCGAAMAAGADPVVLITAFGPFDGRGVNGSETVGRALIAQGIPGVELHLVVMPVGWNEPLKRLPPAVEQFHPQVLIGLGEGLGGIQVEQIGLNLSYGVDVYGVQRLYRRILSGTEDKRQSTLLFDAARVSRSYDAGMYLCNASLYISLGLGVPRTGFVHLTPQGSADAPTYIATFLPIIRELVLRNVTDLTSP
jgi:pyrrolidone-carboxylate peptidase